MTSPSDAVTVVAIRRRASAQSRLRREADLLDAWAVKVQIPVRRDPDDVKPAVTAAQLRLVADFLDCSTWGQTDG